MLIRPAPFPGELDRGYMGRVMRINGIVKETDAVDLLSAWAGGADKSRQKLSLIESLSLVAGMDLPMFVTRHTTFPLRRGITSCRPDLPHGSESNRRMLWSSGMGRTRMGAYFCTECAKEDLGFHGQSYWRRKHQIPGLLCCPKHSTPLRYMDDESAFFLSPMGLINDARAVDAERAREVAGNETIQRYLQICRGLMERTSPLSAGAVQTVLNSRAFSLGLQTRGQSVTAPLLSDVVIYRCGRTWLATVLPVLADKPESVLLNRFDGMLYLSTYAGSTASYALACAALFDTADEAINALSNPTTVLERCRQWQINPTQEELVHAYIQSRGDRAQIASHLGIPIWMVGFRLRKIGCRN